MYFCDLCGQLVNGWYQLSYFLPVAFAYSYVCALWTSPSLPLDMEARADQIGN